MLGFILLFHISVGMINMKCPEGDAHAMICLVRALSGITLLSQDLVLEHNIWNSPNISVIIELNTLHFINAILALMVLCNAGFAALSLLTSGENASGFKAVLLKVLLSFLLCFSQLDAKCEKVGERNV